MNSAEFELLPVFGWKIRNKNCKIYIQIGCTFQFFCWPLLLAIYYRKSPNHACFFALIQALKLFTCLDRLRIMRISMNKHWYWSILRPCFVGDFFIVFWLLKRKTGKLKWTVKWTLPELFLVATGVIFCGDPPYSYSWRAFQICPGGISLL